MVAGFNLAVLIDDNVRLDQIILHRHASSSMACSLTPRAPFPLGEVAEPLLAERAVEGG